MPKKYLIIKPSGNQLNHFSQIGGLNSNNILLVEGNEIVNDDGKIATNMNRYFRI